MCLKALSGSECPEEGSWLLKPITDSAMRFFHNEDSALQTQIGFFLQIWRELFSPLHALNFGIDGDTTGHVLWRLKNGELENIKPKVHAEPKARSRVLRQDFSA